MLKSFLNKYDTVIFDMDGVMTGEQNYWNCAALTVWEFYYSRFGGEKAKIKEWSQTVDEIRKKVFFDDFLISALKDKGVNSNWDLGYITLALMLISDGREDIFDLVRDMGENILYELDNIADKLSKKINKDIAYTERNGTLWQEMFHCFQEWFLGAELYEETYGKKCSSDEKHGLIYSEEPIVDKNELIKLVLELKSGGKRLCIGTGRPKNEIITPLEKWGILKYFAEDGRITFDNVQNAEKNIGSKALTKPHPYVFLKALLGDGYDDNRIFCGDYDKSCVKRTLVVGDAGADMLAAQAMGADFCAVLTGVSGKAARDYFKRSGADYIIDSVLDLIERNEH